MEPLTNQQTRLLKARAQKLDPVVRIGRAGLSESLVRSVDEALSVHGLIKVRFAEFKEEKDSLSEALAEKTGSILVTRVGHVVVLYRPKPKPQEN